jgi:hypothetical protein
MADAKTFEGKNGLKARRMYEERLKFMAHAYASPGYYNFSPVNMRDFWWKEFAFYGKISDVSTTLTEPIEVYVPYLKSMATKRTGVYALNFVADAFAKFRQDFLLEIRTGNLKSDDPHLSDITAKKGYSHIEKEYDNMQQAFYRAFLKHIKLKNIKTKIQTLEDFIDEMFRLLETGGKLSFTKSSFIMSRFCNPMISGLALEISNLPYSKDKEKKEFIDSPNFDGYTKLAAKNGFVVDKNIPWRLVADIGSPVMVAMAQQYKPDVNNHSDILHSFFVQTSVYELDIFKSYILKFYNQFVKDNPINIRTTHTGVSTNKVREARKFKTKEEFDELYGDEFWLENYIKIRNKETGLNYPDPAIKSITCIAKDILKTLDTPSAMRYIKGKFTGFEFHEGTLNAGLEKINQRNSGLSDFTVKETITNQARKTRKIFY